MLDDLSLGIARIMRDQARDQDKESRRRPLTPRELVVAQLLAEGRSAKEVASTLGIETKTAEVHTANAYRKLGVHNKAQLRDWAVENGVVPRTQKRKVQILSSALK